MKWMTLILLGFAMGTPLSATSEWWEAFHDPAITQFASQALKQNADLKQAEYKINELKAKASITQAGRLPDISLVGYATQGNLQTVTQKEASIAQLGVQAQWPIDAFGGTKSAIKSADCRVDSAESDYRQLQITLIDALVTAIITWRENILSAQALQQQIQATSTKVDVIQVQYNAGIIDQLKLQEASSHLVQLKAILPAYDNAISLAQFQIEQLTASLPTQVTQVLADTKDTPIIIPPVTDWMTPDRLKDRPDIQSIRAELYASQSDLSKAEADLWPSMSLNGIVKGQSASDSAGPLNDTVWSVGASISYPILNFGRLRGAVDVSNAKAQQLLNRYYSVLLKATQDIQASASAYQTQVDAAQKWTAAKENRKQISTLTQDQYKAGIVDLATASAAQADWAQAERNAIQATAQAAKAYVQLQRSQTLQ